MLTRKMKKEEEQTKKWLHNSLLLGIGITIIFLIISIWIGLNINNEATCSVDRYTNVSSSDFINSVHILNDENTAVLQEFEFTQEYLKYKFCFDVNSSNNNRFSVVDVNNNSLAQMFVDNTTTHYCTFIDDSEIQLINFLGVRCDTCNSTSTATIFQELVGADVTQISTDFADVSTTYLDNSLGYRIFAHANCKPQLKFATGLYFTLLLIIILIMLIILGIDKFRKALFEEWS